MNSYRFVGVLLVVVGSMAAVSCGGEGCLNRHLERWCYHTEGGPEGWEENACPPLASPEPPEDAPSCRFVATGSSPIHYFSVETGEHVATRYGSDNPQYCGGFSYWYGMRVPSEDDCLPEP
jgi:hypothetical protein